MSEYTATAASAAGPGQGGQGGGFDWGQWPDGGDGGTPFPAGHAFRSMRKTVPKTTANEDGQYAVFVDVPVLDEKGKPKPYVDDQFHVQATTGLGGAHRAKAPRLSAHVTTAYALDKATARVCVAGDCSLSGVDEIALLKAGAIHVDVLTLGRTSKYGGQ